MFLCFLRRGVFCCSYTSFVRVNYKYMKELEEFIPLQGLTKFISSEHKSHNFSCCSAC